MKLNIIEKKKIRKLTSSHVMWISVLILVGLWGSIYFEILHSNSLIYVLLLIFALIPIATNIYGNYEYFPNDFNTVSTIHLKEDEIVVDKEKLELNNIRRIKLEINDWFGKKIVKNVRPYGSGPKLSTGINNTLEIHLKDSKQFLLKFQLESNEQFIELGSWIETLYKSKIEILEKYDHLKSYGLKHLDYKEIQVFKEKNRVGKGDSHP